MAPHRRCRPSPRRGHLRHGERGEELTYSEADRAGEDSEPGFRALEKMAEAGIEQTAIDVFARNLAAFASGDSGYIPEDTIRPLMRVPRADSAMGTVEECRAALAKTAVIRLNGGLGTSMGLNAAKSLLPILPDTTFLDVIVRQIRHLRRSWDVELPLVFMNSFRTEADTMSYLGTAYPDLDIPGLPGSFLQNRVPKILPDTLEPVDWPADPSLEWCPPGHGDLFSALPGSGVLDALLDRGIEYALVSNSDNLGAFPEPSMAAWFARSRAPFVMEVCKRTAADRKGGHVAIRLSDGATILREVAQVLPEEVGSFQDIERHRYFNTNNLWLDLRTVRDVLDERDGVLGLPIVSNRKTVDPTDPASPEVAQIETGMGTAIEVFPDALAIEVDRSRFVPVKTTNDLLMLRSDLFEISSSGRLIQQVPSLPAIDLDRRYFSTIADFEARIPHAPSLRDVSSLTVRGDATVPRTLPDGGDVRIDGDDPAT